MTPRETYLVFDPEDRWHGSLCRGEAEVREILAGIKDTSHVHVHRVTEGEIVRDVSDEFLAEADPLPEPVFNRTAYMRQAGAFGR